MKIIFVFIILIVSFVVGYSYKQNINDQLNFYRYLKNFVEYFKANINLFKNNLVDIIDNYIELNINKNAKFNEIFYKNAEIYQISENKLENIIYNKQEIQIINNYFNTLGKNNYEFETKKIENFEYYLNEKIIEYSNYIKTKGELFFKIALSIGAVVAILIW